MKMKYIILTLVIILLISIEVILGYTSPSYVSWVAHHKYAAPFIIFSISFCSAMIIITLAELYERLDKLKMKINRYVHPKPGSITEQLNELLAKYICERHINKSLMRQLEHHQNEIIELQESLRAKKVDKFIHEIVIKNEEKKNETKRSSHSYG